MQHERRSIQGDVGITFVSVTRDQEEALTMSDRLAVFADGRIEQVGPTWQTGSRRTRSEHRRAERERRRGRRPHEGRRGLILAIH